MLLTTIIIIFFHKKKKGKLKKKGIYYTLVFYFVFVSLVFFVIPKFLPLKNFNTESSTVIFSSDGQEIGEIPFQNSKKTIRHREISYQEIPDFLKKTLIAIEDKRFWKQNGFDIIGFVRAIKNNFKKLKVVEGASTISMQLIRNTYWLNEKRTIPKKLKEIFLARALNFQYSKEKILTFYINKLDFGYLNYGFQSAALFYFDKSLENLTNAEIFSLLTIAKNSSKYNPYKHLENFENRYKKLAKTLFKRGVFSQEKYNQILSEKLFFADKTNKEKAYFQYITDTLGLKYSQSLKDKKKVVTTIDASMTQEVQEIAFSTVSKLQRKNVGDYGILILDRNTNEVKTLIGGINYNSPNGQVNSVFQKRQAGSTVKPFTYLYAFETLGKKPTDKILDIPRQFKNNFGFAYNPKDFDLKYKGEVTIGEALASSLNIPAISIANTIGVGNLLKFYHKVGFDSLDKSADFYGLPLTLGAGELSLWELTRAFGIFAHGGYLCEPYLYQKTSNPHFFQNKNIICKKITEKKYTKMIEEILSNRYLKLYGFPINSNLDFKDLFVVAKSGTSRHFTDNRVIGYTKNYIIGIWVGNKNGEHMKGVSGVSGAGDIFRKLVYFLEKTNIQEDLSDEAHFLNKKTDEVGSDYLEIISPLGGSVYKIDETIELSKQKVPLKFITNVEYDEIQRKVCNPLKECEIFNTKNPYFNIYENGRFDIFLNLFKNGKIISNNKVSIEVVE